MQSTLYEKNRVLAEEAKKEIDGLMEEVEEFKERVTAWVDGKALPKLTERREELQCVVDVEDQDNPRYVSPEICNQLMSYTTEDFLGEMDRLSDRIYCLGNKMREAWQIAGEMKPRGQ